MKRWPLKLSMAFAGTPLLAALVSLVTSWSCSRKAVALADQILLAQQQRFTLDPPHRRLTEQLRTLPRDGQSLAELEAQLALIEEELEATTAALEQYKALRAREASLVVQRSKALTIAQWALQFAVNAGAISVAIGALSYGIHQRRSIRRIQMGLCVRCGYDLRATPDRCPECGTVPAAASKSA